jgi:outer membrane immunogenic protein
MKKLVATVFSLIFAGSSYAADMSIPYKAASLFNWSGCYVGAQGGYARNKPEMSVVGTPFVLGDTGNATVGGTLGCNWQSSNFVFGVEADGSWLDHKSVTGPVAVGIGTATESLRWESTLRGRLGWAADRTLFYVTGGWALVGANTSQFAPLIVTTASSNATLDGAVYGGGIEHMVSPNWSVKFEYLHVNAKGTASYTTGGFNPTLNAKAEQDIVRIGLNYRFSN